MFAETSRMQTEQEVAVGSVAHTDTGRPIAQAVSQYAVRSRSGLFALLLECFLETSPPHGLRGVER